MEEKHEVKYDPKRNAIVETNAHLADANKVARAKEIEQRYPPYNVKALRQAVQDKRSSIADLDRQTKKLNREITHFQTLAKQCERRDKELAELLDG
jgi:chromosome segregation ATPase